MAIKYVISLGLVCYLSSINDFSSNSTINNGRDKFTFKRDTLFIYQEDKRASWNDNSGFDYQVATGYHPTYRILRKESKHTPDQRQSVFPLNNKLSVLKIKDSSLVRPRYSQSYPSHNRSSHKWKDNPQFHAIQSRALRSAR